MFRLHLTQRLAKTLQRNESCSGICNIPGAEVPIDTQGSPPSNVRQYRIPFRKQILVDDQVQKWLKEGIIEFQQDVALRGTTHF